MDKKNVAISLLCAISIFYSVPVLAFSVEEATIDSVHQAIQEHRITCVKLVKEYLDRIKKYNLSVEQQAPINAFTEINPSVLTEAKELDQAFDQSGELVGPLHCIPVILKDNIDTYDTTTTSGSYALLGNQPVKDADLTLHLRNAGAIILGKGGMDEFAWGMFGFSSRSGRIGNVYNTAMNPGGSSGGSSAAVSANFAAIGVGTDNSGSVRIPAIYNGLVGLRPTTALISQQGIFPMGNLDGTAGPIARTTTDLAILLDVIAVPQPTSRPAFVSYLKKGGLQSKRIGIVHHVGNRDTFQQIDSDVNNAIIAMQQVMQANGAVFINVDLPNFDNTRTDNQAGEIEAINAYLVSFPAVRKDFRDICESDRTRIFGNVKDCLKFMNSVPAKNSRQYQNVLTLFSKNRAYVEKIMQDNHLDALLMPLSTQAAGSYQGDDVNTWQAAISSNSGLPAISFVIGYNKDNMPIGVDLTGMQLSEGKLISIAYAYEQITHLRRIPAMPAPSLKLSTSSIPQINNVISEIGKATYDHLIKPEKKPGVHTAEIVTPERFRKIVAEVLGSSK